MLVATLQQRLLEADALLLRRQYVRAEARYGEVIEAAQACVDVDIEVSARAMLVRSLLFMRRPEEAHLHLVEAESARERVRLETQARVWGSVVRYARVMHASDDADGLAEAYLSWAETHGLGSALLDACLLRCHTLSAAQRANRLERVLALVRPMRRSVRLEAQAERRLAQSLESVDETWLAREAYRRAAERYDAAGQERAFLLMIWAVASLCCKMEDWSAAAECMERLLPGVEPGGSHPELGAMVYMIQGRIGLARDDVSAGRDAIIKGLQAARDSGPSMVPPAVHAELVSLGERFGLER